ncbi:MAG TPA: alpha/beta hydrolase [Acidimicrobiales bacterium]|nr:alpha/beta hydrolase [Acidimicrobiales bacterium]
MAAGTRWADVGGLQLAYETFGSPGDPALLLVMGLATQMIAWPDPFCEELAGSGRYVVRFDNRDTGLSTHLSELPVPTPARALLRLDRAPYSIDDMAADAVGLIDALGLGTVDVVGASMGGFIAQTVALQSPGRVRTLTLMMTSTGSWRVGRPGLRTLWKLVRRGVVEGREGVQDAAVAVYGLIGSRAPLFDEHFVRDVAGRAYDRGLDPAGDARQLAAVLTQANRTRGLRALTIPTLVIHGLDDRLVAPTGGLALARTIPSARFIGYHGMGHDLPPSLWSELAHQIAAHAHRREPTARAG